MMKEEPSKTRVVRLEDQTLSETLPFRVELWQDGKSKTIERVLARAVSAALGRAIFNAALSEHPDRRITLRRGSRVIADSAKQ
jgi:hypothetical protein